jgi:hypothetical protein
MPAIFRGIFGNLRGILKFLFIISRLLAEPWMGNTDDVDSVACFNAIAALDLSD